ncbi:ATP-binding protein [Aquabacterium sp. A08]|uniref:sensor histidine kinase n=1 Tax=Aquabacterium sp. A08 TaxID=2718532 RepID=UPI0014215910|nr:ATP-binding protein [Aquabacterium sp. A08]NIC41283.1 hypothetical protein [Aquabacterium sp. A08]NIC41295.1 hypothetical protein [Aquabacterium sp. A08]NIC42424.1 hypothetical protein [Aquabacterium sp. A08]
MFDAIHGVFCRMNRASAFRHLLVVALLAWLLAWASAAQAQDHIVERHWLEDPSGQKNWPEVQQSPTQAFKGTLSRGYGRSVIWLKLRIDPGVSARKGVDADRLVLRIRPVYLDEVRLFDPLVGGAVAHVTGDLQHPRGDEFESLDFTIPIARGEAPRDIWLSLRSTSTRQIHVEALNVDDLIRQTQRQAIFFAGYIGLVAVLALWAILQAVFSREPVISAFALAQVTSLSYAVVSSGYLRSVWPAQWPAGWIDQSSSLLSIVSVSSAVLFHVLLLREFSPPRWATRLHLVLLGIFPIKLVLYASGMVSAALHLNLSEVTWSPFIFLLSVYLATGWQAATPQRPAMARPVVLLFYVVLVITLMFAALPGLGLISGSEMTLYIIQTHILITALLILVMLQYRSHTKRQQQRSTEMALHLTQLQAQQEREVREEQGRLLAMLAHELKTPLAAILMRLDQSETGREIKQSIGDMNRVIDRCLHATQVSDGQLQARHVTVDVCELIRKAIAGVSCPGRIGFSAAQPCLVSTDPQLLLIALNNLLENACKYAHTDGPIEVELQRPAQGAVLHITVRNPPGVAGWPDPDQVFHKYYRSTQARRQSGTGLGLYLVRNLMRALAGDVRYVPDERWIRFVLSLPSGSAAPGERPFP